MTMINILLVEDQALVRAGFKKILDDTPSMCVIAEVGTAEDALDELSSIKPDIVLMDISMPGMGGLAATCKITSRYPDIGIIALTAHTKPPFLSRMIEAGALGYITKGCSCDELILAIKTVHKGKQYIGVEAARQAISATIEGSHCSPFERLSARELEIVLMLTQRQRSKEIANQLCISTKTVCAHRYHIYEKLGIESDLELALLATQFDLLDADSGGSRSNLI